MTRINLDSHPEIIRQFVLDLSTRSDGTVLESAGKPVACLIPPPKVSPGGSPPAAAWTEEMNGRRCDLLDRKYDQGLSSDEEVELALLQDAWHRYVDQVAPLPLEAARQLHQELLRKAGKALSDHDA